MSGIQFEYNSLSRNQQRLHEVSIDSTSGIQTFIDNSAKSPDITITSVIYGREQNTNNIKIFLSSTMVYRKEIEYITNKVIEQKNRVSLRWIELTKLKNRDAHETNHDHEGRVCIDS